MGLKWTAATAAIQVALADGAIEARVTSGWSSLKGLWLSDDASSITVAGAGNVMVTALSGTGAAITVEAVKSGTVRGGSGDDTVVFSAYSDAPNRPTASGVYDNLVSIFGGDGNDTIVCQDWNGWTAFVVDGGNGNDVILGGDGNDRCAATTDAT